MLETAILTAWPAIERGGPWVLLAAVVWFLMNGRLTTARAHDKRVADLIKGHDDRVADLKATIDAQGRTIDALIRQKDELLAGARISVRALDAIRKQSELGGDDAMVA